MAKLIINPTAANRRELTLRREQILTIGRDPSNDLVLPDAMVSRRHAVIEHRGSQFFLRDCSSANGSVVNGDRVSERGLRDGDLVAIGSMRLLFREEAAEPGAKVVPHPSAAPFRCPTCDADFRRGDLYCRECGTQVAQPSGPPKAVCASCGSAVALPARFCSACGSTLASDGERVEPNVASEEEDADVPASRKDTQPVARPSARGETGGAARVGASALPAPEPRVVSAARSTDPSPEVSPAFRPGRPDPSRERREQPRSPAAPRPAVASAGLASRLAAGLVDAVFVLSGQTVIVGPVLYYWWSREIPRTPADVAFLPIAATVALTALAALLGGLYHVYGWGVRGTTPGKELLELRVETEQGVSPIGLGRAGLRLLGYMLSAASFGVGFLMIATGGGALHDRIAGTRVVRGSRR